jgi:hypothetical protein
MPAMDMQERRAHHGIVCCSTKPDFVSLAWRSEQRADLPCEPQRCYGQTINNHKLICLSTRCHMLSRVVSRAARVMWLINHMRNRILLQV